MNPGSLDSEPKVLHMMLFVGVGGNIAGFEVRIFRC